MFFKIPKDKTLQLFLGWMIAGGLARWLFEGFSDSTTLSGMAGRFLTSWFATYAYGALWSGIPLIAVTAYISVGVLVLVCFFPALQSKGLAKAAVGILILASLFTFWLEPLTTVAGVAAVVLFGFGGILDMIVSAVWCLMWLAAIRSIDREMKPVPVAVAVVRDA